MEMLGRILRMYLRDKVSLHEITKRTGLSGNTVRRWLRVVPLKFELGGAFQFDWSEEGLVVGGIYHRMQVSHMKLFASRAFWPVAYPSQGHERLFDAHTCSFAALGGVARRGIYDLHVDGGGQGDKGRVVNARFAVMCAHYLFDAPPFQPRASARRFAMLRSGRRAAPPPPGQ